MIQDWIFTAGSLAFIVGILPSLRGPDKPALSTSIIYALTLFGFAATYVSLGLHMTAVITGVSGSTWIMLAYQEWRQV